MDYKKPFEDQPNKGAIFANKTKTNPKAPDYRGTVLLDLNTYEVINNCIKVELSGWKTTAKSGLVYLDIRAQKPYEDGKTQPQQTKLEELDDDIEF